MLTTVILALCVAASIAGLEVPGKEPTAMSTRRATGSFSVKMRSPDATAAGEFMRILIDKQFQGGLQGTSVVEMLASNAGDQAAGGYVALERFSGTLDGREGSFVLQHSGTMSPKGMHLDVQVSPGSGTGELAGLEGRLTVRIEGKEHFYELEYSLPD
jgi:hypothetical protein